MDASNYIYWSAEHESSVRSRIFSVASVFALLVVAGLTIAFVEAKYGFGVSDDADPASFYVMG